MTGPFIHHLHIIHAQLYYTYIHIYNLETYLQLKSVKSIKLLKTNKTTVNLNWGLAPINEIASILYVYVTYTSEFIYCR